MEDTALPPMQVGVWIPKAKMGPEADNFRPLGMPNTLDRLVDGTIATQHAPLPKGSYSNSKFSG